MESCELGPAAMNPPTDFKSSVWMLIVSLLFFIPLIQLNIRMFGSLTCLLDFSVMFVLFEIVSVWEIFSLPDFLPYGSSGTCIITPTFNVNNVNQFISCFLVPKFTLTLDSGIFFSRR